MIQQKSRLQPVHFEKIFQIKSEISSIKPVRNTLNASSPPHSVDNSVVSLQVYAHFDGFNWFLLSSKSLA